MNYPLTPPEEPSKPLPPDAAVAILQTVDVLVSMAEGILDACTEIKATVAHPDRPWMNRP